MLNNLIKRPIAVTMSIIAIMILGCVAISMLPVSLMPNVDIPQITVQISQPGANAAEINENLIQPIRNQLIQLSNIKEMKCSANNGGGIIFMQFEHGSNLDYNYIEVNEKVDRAFSVFPKDVERPKVVKANATDIPVFFIDITPTDNADFVQLSKFAKEVISKRLEQVEEVALVDISGVQGEQILIEPYKDKTTSLNITPNDMENAMFSNNISLGNLTIKDGYYQWNIRFDSQISNKEEIENINLNINNRVYKLKDLAKVSLQPSHKKGLAKLNDKRSVTFAVIKQSDAKMSRLKSNMETLITNMKKEYPNVTFTLSKNQTELLDYSIDNLKTNIIIGALLAILVIFFFLKDFKSPLLIIITIPLSLVVSLLALYLVGVTINIISLSGLILGIGMMVDNSIIVIDNITQYWDRGEKLDKAIVRGTQEVIAPMISSVLTTCSVFLPLIFLSGIAGSLFYDQAMGVTIALFSSLVVAVIVIPVYYRLLYKKNDNATNIRKENTLLNKIQFINYNAIYEKSLKWVFRHQKISWVLFLSCIPLTFLIYTVIDKSQLPPITQKDIVMSIDWNSSITVDENEQRINNLIAEVKEYIISSNSLIGEQDFLLGHSGEIMRESALVYFQSDNAENIDLLKNKLQNILKEKYPKANSEFKQSANIFNMIFANNEPPLVARLKSNEGKILHPDKINAIISKIKEKLPDIYFEPVLWQEQILFIANKELMELYNVNFSQVYNVLSKATHDNKSMFIKSGTFNIPVIFSNADEYTSNLLALKVRNEEGTDIPINLLVQERRIRDLKKIISGKDGDYYPLNIYLPDKDVKAVAKTIEKISKEDDSFDVSFSGSYFSSRELINELIMVLIVSLLLLFFILAAQFESLLQPFIILSEIIVDLLGSFFLLYICGAGINLMSLIGIVVMCGIVINDSILKVDTINRLRKDGYSLLKAIMYAGSRRLKPILMTSLTTILAIAPFLIKGDIGSDLQFPLSVALIGGMTLGTIVSIFFIPLFYYQLYKNKK